MKHHHLHSSVETCHWGCFDATLQPVLTIASGDEVTVDTVSGGPAVLPRRRIPRAARTAEHPRPQRTDAARATS